MKTSPRITVLLAEDHEIVRSGLVSLLQVEKDFDVVGEARTGRQAVEMARKLHPDVVVMDIAMPLLNGIEATRQIRLVAPATRVLVLSAHSDDAYLEGAMAAGASGYLVKQSSAHSLTTAIRCVHQGGDFFSPDVGKRLGRQRASGLDRLGRSVPRVAGLTSREMEVLQLVAEGAANKQTADELGISVKTVEKHRNNLMQKLDIHETAGLTRYAIGAGIIESRVQVTVQDPDIGAA